MTPPTESWKEHQQPLGEFLAPDGSRPEYTLYGEQSDRAVVPRGFGEQEEDTVPDPDDEPVGQAEHLDATAESSGALVAAHTIELTGESEPPDEGSEPDDTGANEELARVFQFRQRSEPVTDAEDAPAAGGGGGEGGDGEGPDEPPESDADIIQFPEEVSAGVEEPATPKEIDEREAKARNAIEKRTGYGGGLISTDKLEKSIDKDIEDIEGLFTERRTKIPGVDLPEKSEPAEPTKPEATVTEIWPGASKASEPALLIPLEQVYRQPSTTDDQFEDTGRQTAVGDMMFHKPLGAGVTGHTLAEYNGALFPDFYENVSMPPESKLVAGGVEEAFKPGNTVVDLGSGQARALAELHTQHPNVTFIGIDIGYGEDRLLMPHFPGSVQLSHGDWTDGVPLPDHSADTVLMCGADIPGGLDNNNVYLQETIDEVTRITKPGGTFRFDINPENDIDRRMINWMLRTAAEPWDVHEIVDNEGVTRAAMVAVKRPVPQPPQPPSRPPQGPPTIVGM